MKDSSKKTKGLKNLNRHQIDVIRRAIKYLIARDGEASLVSLASYLLSLNEKGFIGDNWCGYPKFRPMIDAYPEFFEIYGHDATNKFVRIREHVISENQPIRAESEKDFGNFVYRNITPELAQEVSMEFGLNDGLEDYCVFCNYLIYTFYKAVAEGKVLQFGNLRMFHTGWFHNNTDDVYMLWGIDQDGRIQKCFMRRSCKVARDFIRHFGNRTPQMVEYPVLQFDPNLNFETEYGHIIDEHVDRIPEEIIEMLRHNPDLQNCSDDLSKEEIVRRGRNFLRRLLTGCIDDTRSRLGNRRDEAVLFWNKRADKMCWLIPLRFGVTERVNLTLIVEPTILNGDSVYRAHTILPLREAFKCARLLGPVRAEWLRDSWKDE